MRGGLGLKCKIFFIALYSFHQVQEAAKPTRPAQTHLLATNMMREAAWETRDPGRATPSGLPSFECFKSAGPQEAAKPTAKHICLRKRAFES